KTSMFAVTKLWRIGPIGARTRCELLYRLVCSVWIAGIAMPATAESYKYVDLYTIPEYYANVQNPQVDTEGNALASGFNFENSYRFHASLWGSPVAAFVDLHPTNLSLSANSISSALGIGGGRQVGSFYDSAVGRRHAVLWDGTADSAVDLHP